MSVVIFPRRHAGERGPGSFAFHLPSLKNEPAPIVLSGVPPETQAAVQVEIDRFSAAIADAGAAIENVTALLRPYMAEDVR